MPVPELYLGFRGGFEIDDPNHSENVRSLEDWARQLIDNGWQRIEKKADQTKASDTTTNPDTDLQFELLANETYIIKGRIWFDADVTPDFKYQFTWPASPTRSRLVIEDIVAGGAAKTLRLVTDATQADVTLLSAATAGGFITFDMLLQNGANAGIFAFEWSQATSSATAITVRKGSYIEYGII